MTDPHSTTAVVPRLPTPAQRWRAALRPLSRRSEGEAVVAVVAVRAMILRGAPRGGWAAEACTAPVRPTWHAAAYEQVQSAGAGASVRAGAIVDTWA